MNNFWKIIFWCVLVLSVFAMILAMLPWEEWGWLGDNTIMTRPAVIFIIVALAIILSLLTGGKAFTSTWVGAFVDERNKMSLSRFQIVIWTIIVIAGFFAVADNNIREFYGSSRVSAEADLTSPLDIDVPAELIALMGLSAFAALGSSLLKKQQFDDANLASPDSNDDQMKAKLTDMFKAEHKTLPGKEGFRLDITKIQLFFVTVAFAIVYVYNLLALTNQVGPISSLPGIEGGLVGLLGVSQGMYLVHKGVAAPKADK